MPREHVRYTGSGEREKRDVEWDQIPNECPICHSTILPEHAVGYLKTDGSGTDELQIVYHCPKRGCESFFVATFKSAQKQGRSPQLYELSGVAPQTPVEESFDEVITTLSPNFALVYNQALAARAAGLDQIAGLGLRRALEFLVKDLACRGVGSEEEKAKVRTLALSKVISAHIGDPKVRRCAELATWLGNDEAHYVRKWVDKDVDDLLRLTKLTVLFAEATLLSERYETEMRGGAQSE